MELKNRSYFSLLAFSRLLFSLSLSRNHSTSDRHVALDSLHYIHKTQSTHRVYIAVQVHFMANTRKNFGAQQILAVTNKV